MRIFFLPRIRLILMILMIFIFDDFLILKDWWRYKRMLFLIFKRLAKIKTSIASVFANLFKSHKNFYISANLLKIKNSIRLYLHQSFKIKKSSKIKIIKINLILGKKKFATGSLRNVQHALLPQLRPFLFSVSAYLVSDHRPE